jgi:hypothetical protein
VLVLSQWYFNVKCIRTAESGLPLKVVYSKEGYRPTGLSEQEESNRDRANLPCILRQSGSATLLVPYSVSIDIRTVDYKQVMKLAQARPKRCHHDVSICLPPVPDEVMSILEKRAYGPQQVFTFKRKNNKRVMIAAEWDKDDEPDENAGLFWVDTQDRGVYLGRF